MHTVSVSFFNGEVYSVDVQYSANCYVLKDKTSILGLNNNVTYVPVNDYNPSTKKYVDDMVGNINTILATLTTPSNGGN